MNHAPIRTPIPAAAQGATCGQCKHAHTASVDLREPLECRGAPPTPCMLVQGGRLTIHTIYPRVDRTNPICGHFVLKLELQPAVNAQ